MITAKQSHYLCAAEIAIAQLMLEIETEQELGAAWAAISATLIHAVQSQSHSKGIDYDRVKSSVDKFFLQEPVL